MNKNIEVKNKYRLDDKYVYIELTNRKKIKLETIIDRKNFSKILEVGLKWRPRLEKWNNLWYPVATKITYDKNGKRKSTTISLHRLIVSYELVDHINRNPLDNRESNLREADRSKNAMNRKSKNSNNTSGYRNVTFINGWYRVQLQINGKNKLFRDKFESPKTAGNFAQEMRNKYYGEFSGNE